MVNEHDPSFETDTVIPPEIVLVDPEMVIVRSESSIIVRMSPLKLLSSPKTTTLTIPFV